MNYNVMKYFETSFRGVVCIAFAAFCFRAIQTRVQDWWMSKGSNDEQQLSKDLIRVERTANSGNDFIVMLVNFIFCCQLLDMVIPSTAHSKSLEQTIRCAGLLVDPLIFIGFNTSLRSSAIHVITWNTRDKQKFHIVEVSPVSSALKNEELNEEENGDEFSKISFENRDEINSSMMKDKETYIDIGVRMRSRSCLEKSSFFDEL